MSWQELRYQPNRSDSHLRCGNRLCLPVGLVHTPLNTRDGAPHKNKQTGSFLRVYPPACAWVGRFLANTALSAASNSRTVRSWLKSRRASRISIRDDRGSSCLPMRIWLYGLVVEPPFSGINIVAEDRGLQWAASITSLSSQHWTSHLGRAWRCSTGVT